MRILFALPGLHRFDRGAEIAFVALATEFVKMGDTVTLIGAGDQRPGAPYRFLHAGAIRRERFERFPRGPILRGDTSWEEATFIPGLLAAYRPRDYDVTLTCSFPLTNWVLRRPVLGGKAPAHVYVTQNGDWPAFADTAEYRTFGCDGLVCTNPDYFERNRDRWRCALIPNGIDTARFTPGPPERERLGLPAAGPIVLMVSALIPSKRVAEGVRAVAGVPGAQLVVAGDGAERATVDALAAELLPGRFTRLTVPAADMPALYRSADAFLHLSKDESFGNVYVEALACGLPVVAHDIPRVRWIVGDGEYLVDTDDGAATTASIAAALAAPPAGESRVQRAAGFAWPAIAAQYRAFFDTVVAAR